MKRTLEEYLNLYEEKIETIKLYFGEHEIIIELNKSGSFVLIKIFRNLTFENVSLDNESLVLKHKA